MTVVKRPLRVYADTSVFGGCFDKEFRVESTRFFEEVRQGQFVVVVSSATLDEIELAPEAVRRVLAELAPSQVDLVDPSKESERSPQGLPWCRCRRARIKDPILAEFLKRTALLPAETVA